MAVCANKCRRCDVSIKTEYDMRLVSNGEPDEWVPAEGLAAQELCAGYWAALDLLGNVRIEVRRSQVYQADDKPETAEPVCEACHV